MPSPPDPGVDHSEEIKPRTDPGYEPPEKIKPAKSGTDVYDPPSVDPGVDHREDIKPKSDPGYEPPEQIKPPKSGPDEKPAGPDQSDTPAKGSDTDIYDPPSQDPGVDHSEDIPSDEQDPARLDDASDDADSDFSDKDIDSPQEPCDKEGPEFANDGADAVNKSDRYSDCPDDTKDQIKSRPWTDSEQQGVNEVLDKYQPLMQCPNQPIKKFARTNKSIDDCKPDGSTQGEWFEDSGTVVLTDSAYKGSDFNDNFSNFKGTAAHETAHGLLNHFDPRSCQSYKDSADNPLMQEWNKAAGWDSTGQTLNETDGDKAPTKYAKTNSMEDLSESMMLYTNDPDRLKQSSPGRYAFCQKLMQDSQNRASSQ